MTKSRSSAKRYGSEDFASIRLAMLVVLILGFAIALLLFLAINLGVKEYIAYEYLSEENVKERSDEYVKDLQKYVTENSLTVSDASQIAKWAKENKYVYVLIFNGDQLLFESGASVPTNPGGNETPDGGKGDGENGETPGTETGSNTESGSDKDSGYTNPGFTVTPPSREELIQIAKAKGTEPIYTVDGNMLFASIVDYSEYLYYDVANVVSIIVAMAAFFITMWMYFYSLTRRITKLGKEVTAVADGDVNHPVVIGGDDEITRLSMDIEYMRNSMLENIKKERAALESNKELITAMSHDIRTPLTVLLGYLDIMKQSAPDSAMREYIDASEKTALRLKRLSDDMFGYFLVYGGAIDVELDKYDARTLLDQLLAGHVFLLREQGYDIKYNFEEKDAEFLSGVLVYTDPSQLMRIVENIFSNLLKYAEKSKEIKIEIGADFDEMTIKVDNFVQENPDESLKNGIGLKTCMKIASAMDVRLSAFESDGIYESMICIPLLPDIEYADEDETENRFVAWFKKIYTALRRTFISLFSKSKSEHFSLKEAPEAQSDDGKTKNGKKGGHHDA